MRTDTINFRKQVANTKDSLFSLKRKYLAGRSEFYISDHSINRIVERDLGKDIPFIFRVVRYFINEVFDNVTYTNRTYKINFRGLIVVMCISTRLISEGYEGKRCAVLKTVYTHDVDFDFDETINLV